MGLEAVGRDDRRRLGQAVALEHGNAQGIEEALEVDVEQGPAADEEPETAAEVRPDLAEEELVVEGDQRPFQLLQALALVPAFGVVVDGRLHGLGEEGLHLGPLLPDALLDRSTEALGQGRNAQEKLRPGLLDIQRDVAQRFHGRPAQLDRGDGGAAGHQAVDAAGVGEGMVPGQDEERNVVFLTVDEGPGLFDVGRVVPVGQDDALGVGRGARGVADVGRVGLLDGGDRVFDRGRARSEQVTAAAQDLGHRDLVLAPVLDRVEDHDRGQIGQVVADLADLAELGLRYDGHPASGMGQAELEVARLIDLDRNGDVDGPCRQNAELGRDPIAAAFRDERRPVAAPEAEGKEPGGELVDKGTHVRKGRRLIARSGLLPDQDVRGEGLDALFEEPRQCPFGHGSLLVGRAFSSSYVQPDQMSKFILQAGGTTKRMREAVDWTAPGEGSDERTRRTAWMQRDHRPREPLHEGPAARRPDHRRE